MNYLVSKYLYVEDVPDVFRAPSVLPVGTSVYVQSVSTGNALALAKITDVSRGMATVSVLKRFS